jgi:toxin ParE1/3/4
MAKYVLSPLAEVDLDGIWDYSADRWGNVQANDYLAKLREIIARIAARPSRGRACDDIRPGYFRISAVSHVVFYKKVSGGVEIVRVLHQSMEFDQHL